MVTDPAPGDRLREPDRDKVLLMGQAQKKWTSEEYLAFERHAEKKHEFYEGEMFAMSGASKAHNRISWNLVSLLDPQIRAQGCEGFVGDMRIKIPATGFYTYPDLAIACEEPRFEDDQLDTLLNPVALIEILSPTTEGYDYGKKFAHYRSIPELRFYLLVSQAEPRLELYTRRDDGRWLLSESIGLDSVLEIDKLGVELALRQVYARVFS